MYCNVLPCSVWFKLTQYDWRSNQTAAFYHRFTPNHHPSLSHTHTPSSQSHHNKPHNPHRPRAPLLRSPHVPRLTSSSGRSGSRCVKLCSTTGLRSSATSNRTPSQMLRTRHDESNISNSGPGLTRRASVCIPGEKTMDSRLEPAAQSRWRWRHVGVLISDQYPGQSLDACGRSYAWLRLGESWLRLGFSKPRPEEWSCIYGPRKSYSWRLQKGSRRISNFNSPLSSLRDWFFRNAGTNSIRNHSIGRQTGGFYFQTGCANQNLRVRPLNKQFNGVSEGSMKLYFSDVTPRGNYTVSVFTMAADWHQG